MSFSDVRWRHHSSFMRSYAFFFLLDTEEPSYGASSRFFKSHYCWTIDRPVINYLLPCTEAEFNNTYETLIIHVSGKHQQWWSTKFHVCTVQQNRHFSFWFVLSHVYYIQTPRRRFLSPCWPYFNLFFPLSTSQKACSWHTLTCRHLSLSISTTTKKSANWIFTTSQPWDLWLYFHYRCYSWGMYCHRLLGDVQPETFQWAAGSGMCSYRAQPCTHQSVGALSDTGCSRCALNILSELRGE